MEIAHSTNPFVRGAQPVPEQGPKKKKRWPWIVLWTVLAILLILFLIALTLFFMASDWTDGQSQAREDRTREDIADKVLLNAFDGTAQDGRVRLALDKADLDQLLYFAMSDLPENAKQVVNKMYAEIDGDSYKFILQGQYSILKTRVIIHTTLTTDYDLREFHFQVTNVTMGAFGGLFDTILDAMSGTVDTNTFDQAFAASGLHMTFDRDGEMIRYKFDDFAADIAAVMGEETRRNVEPILRVLFENNQVDVDTSQNAFSVYLDLSQTKFNDRYMLSDQPYLDLKTIPQDVNALLTDGKIVISESTAIFNYLVRGYGNLSDAEKAIVEKTDLSATPSFTQANVANKADFAGVVPAIPADPGIVQELQSNLDTSSFNAATGAIGYTVLKESYLNNLLRFGGVLGQTTVIAGAVDGAPKLVYLTLDDISAQIVDDHIYLAVRLNLSGYVSTFIYDVALDAGTVNAQNFTFSLRRSNVNIGTLPAGTDVQDLFFSYLEKAMTNIPNNDWISLDPTTRDINFNLQTAVRTALSQNSDPAIQALAQNASMTPSVIQDPQTPGLAGDGRVRMDLALSTTA